MLLVSLSFLSPLLVRLVESLAGVHVVQASVSDSHSVAVDKEGKVYTWGWGGSIWSGGGLLGHGDTSSHT